jgi:hypothetical protein
MLRSGDSTHDLEITATDTTLVRRGGSPRASDVGAVMTLTSWCSGLPSRRRRRPLPIASLMSYSELVAILRAVAMRHHEFIPPRCSHRIKT